LHLSATHRRAQSARQLRPQAERPERGPRPVPTDSHGRARPVPERTAAAHRGADGSHRRRPVAAPRGSARSRAGATTAPDSPASPLAVRIVDSGVQVVVVNLFTPVYESLSWDCHADGGLLPTGLGDYRDTICPAFDVAYSSLLDDLSDRCLLDSTLVVATGEF